VHAINGNGSDVGVRLLIKSITSSESVVKSFAESLVFILNYIIMFRKNNGVDIISKQVLAVIYTF
jgi:hypothetical protein